MKASLILSFVCAVLAAGTAQAQGFTKSWEQSSQLTPQDRATIQSTAEREIHGKPPGTVANWTNPDGGHSGTIKLLGISTRQGMPCERIEYRIKAPRAARYVFTSCRLPDGTWKFVG